MLKRVLLAFVIPLILVGTAAMIIAYGRGYRLNPKETGLTPTGILVATSNPDGAQVFINGQFRGATNSNIHLTPDWYEVTIAKEGYHDWKRQLRIQGEVVVKTDAILFLKNPSLTPLTATSVKEPILSPDGTRIAYIASPSAQIRTGQSVFESSLRTPTLFLYDFAARNLPFSKNPQPSTITRARLLDEWATEREIMQEKALASMPKEFQTIATDSLRLLSFSPDETKVLYEATASATLGRTIVPALIGLRATEEDRKLSPGSYYVYDVKEDRNYNLSVLLGEFGQEIEQVVLDIDQKEITATSSAMVKVPPYPTKQLPVFWLGTSQHLVLVRQSTISVVEYDGSNELTVYSGPFENGFVFPHPSGNQLIISTTLNPEFSPTPSLYTLNIR